MCWCGHVPMSAICAILIIPQLRKENLNTPTPLHGLCIYCTRNKYGEQVSCDRLWTIATHHASITAFNKYHHIHYIALELIRPAPTDKESCIWLYYFTVSTALSRQEWVPYRVLFWAREQNIYKKRPNRMTWKQ